MSDTPQGPGWWLASDGKYYPPQPSSPPEPPVAPPTAEQPPTMDEQPPTALQPPTPGQPWAPPGPSGAPGGSTSPVPPNMPPPVGPPGSVPPPVPGAPTPSKGGGSKAVLIVLAVVVLLGILGVVGIAALLIARGGSDDEVVVDASPTTVETTAPELGGTDPSTPPAADSDVVVTEVGFSIGEGFDGEQAANAGAVIENSGSTTAAFFEVVFTFTDDSGATVGTETSYVYAIEPGGTGHAAVDAVSLQGTATGVEATAVLGDDPSFWTGTVVPVKVAGVTVDEFFGLQVDGTASNPTDAAIQSANVQCVVRQDGTIVGGASAVLDTIVPGGEVAWEAITFSDWLRGDTAECSGGTYD